LRRCASAAQEGQDRRADRRGRDHRRPVATGQCRRRYRYRPSLSRADRSGSEGAGAARRFAGRF
ncbi:hypothetical protein LTR94_038753, partial [Friedmanniomyces endolithicus]